MLDPADGSRIADFAIASEQDCDDAVAAAAEALPAWSATAPRVRSEILRRAWEILTEEADSFAEIMIRENGKSSGRRDRRGPATPLSSSAGSRRRPCASPATTGSRRPATSGSSSPGSRSASRC